MTSDGARDWLRLFNDLPEGISYECKHGHADCSTTREGECLDEVLEVVRTFKKEEDDGLVWMKGNLPPGHRTTIRTKVPYWKDDNTVTWVSWEHVIEDEPAPLLPAQRLAAEKARREMGDTEEGC